MWSPPLSVGLAFQKIKMDELSPFSVTVEVKPIRYATSRRVAIESDIYVRRVSRARDRNLID